MLAERELLQQIGHVLAERGEAHFDAAVRTDRSDAAGEPQRLGDAVADVDLQDALAPSSGNGGWPATRRRAR